MKFISMSKIHVTGNAGAGKSTLAREIGTALGLPVFGLDKIVWQEGWVKTPPETRAAKERALISRPEWVIEGVSQTVRDAADTVFFLDVDRKTSLIRCAKRNWKFLFTSRPDLPKNCPEILIIPDLIKIIWGFKTHTRPKILADMTEQSSGRFIITDTTDLKSAYRHLGIAE